MLQDGAVSRRESDRAIASTRQATASVQQASAAITQATAGVRAAREELRSVWVNKDSHAAAVASAEAAVRLAEIDLEITRVHAPADGVVGEIGVKLGQYVVPGTQMTSLVPPRVWVIANFKEVQTASIRAGQRAMVEVDALDGLTLRGEVQRLAPATGSEFIVIRPDNATGNFTRVVQRIPVRIELDTNDPHVGRLRPGMSVVATVETANAGQ